MTTKTCDLCGAAPATIEIDAAKLAEWMLKTVRLCAGCAARTSGCTCHEDKGPARGPQHGLGCALYMQAHLAPPAR